MSSYLVFVPSALILLNVIACSLKSNNLFIITSQYFWSKRPSYNNSV